MKGANKIQLKFYKLLSFNVGMDLQGSKNLKRDLLINGDSHFLPQK